MLFKHSFSRFLPTALFLTSVLALNARPADKLVVHEWGTFTSFQDEAGNAVAGINTDDEPVPDFVHNIAPMLLISRSEMPRNFFQGAPSCHPDVTMRLETPVIYFHGGKDLHGKVDVRVEFHGGWLSQYFPDALAVAPGVSANSFGGLNEKTMGSLEWRGLELNADGINPATDSRVWTAPRAVDALQVKTEKGECERFLFYRGVGHLDAPLRVERKEAALLIKGDALPKTGTLWMADVRRDGTAAFRIIHASAGDSTPTRANFDESEYSKTSIATLRGQLRVALLSEGLFADEADALLNTWEVSYFKSFGTRLFFMVPREWTDRVMPLTVSGLSADVTRVMVGRVEMVTPEQRTILKKIASKGAPDAWKEFREPLERKLLSPGAVSNNWYALFDGSKRLDEVGFEPPAIYRDYLNLGRFRNALLLDELNRRPSDNLKMFIEAFGLAGYRP